MKDKEIEFKYSSDGRIGIELPEITDETALAFGRNVLSVRLFDAAANHIDNEIKMILGALFDLFQTTENIYDIFHKLNEGIDITVEDFRAKFPENFKMPTFDDIVRALENIKTLKAKQNEFLAKSKTCNDAAGDLDFGIAFGETWRQVFERLVRENRKTINEAKNAEPPIGFKRVDRGRANASNLIWRKISERWETPSDGEIGQYVSEFFAVAELIEPKAAPPIDISFGLFVKESIDGRVGRVNKYLKSRNECEVVFDPKQWGIIGAGNVKFEVFPASRLTIVPDPRDTQKETPDNWVAPEPRQGFRDVLTESFVQAGDLILHKGAKDWVEATSTEIGMLTIEFYRVARKDGDFWTAQQAIAEKRKPEGYEFLNIDDKIEPNDFVWNIRNQDFLSPDNELIGDVAGHYVRVIRHRPDKTPRETALASIPAGWTVRDGFDTVKNGDKVWTNEGFVDVNNEIDNPVKYFTCVIQPMTTIKPTEENTDSNPAPEMTPRQTAIVAIPDDFVLCPPKEPILKGYKIWNPISDNWRDADADDLDYKTDFFIAVIRPATQVDYK